MWGEQRQSFLPVRCLSYFVTEAKLLPQNSYDSRFTFLHIFVKQVVTE